MKSALRIICIQYALLEMLCSFPKSQDKALLFLLMSCMYFTLLRNTSPLACRYTSAIVTSAERYFSKVYRIEIFPCIQRPCPKQLEQGRRVHNARTKIVDYRLKQTVTGWCLLQPICNPNLLHQPPTPDQLRSGISTFFLSTRVVLWLIFSLLLYSS